MVYVPLGIQEDLYAPVAFEACHGVDRDLLLGHSDYSNRLRSRKEAGRL